MKNFQVPLDEKLIDRIDKAIKNMGTTRSAFVSKVLRDALRKRELERKHSDGYRKQPVVPGEFDIWEQEQAWGER